MKLRRTVAGVTVQAISAGGGRFRSIPNERNLVGGDGREKSTTGEVSDLPFIPKKKGSSVTTAAISLDLPKKYKGFAAAANSFRKSRNRKFVAPSRLRSRGTASLNSSPTSEITDFGGVSTPRPLPHSPELNLLSGGVHGGGARLSDLCRPSTTALTTFVADYGPSDLVARQQSFQPLSRADNGLSDLFRPPTMVLMTSFVDYCPSNLRRQITVFPIFVARRLRSF
ncbi:hypothetical protein M5K25_002334 [Dendrobium thyrsiflorum]|uniref:Uncharacterized protein n=1 Tax=Dendrobium thyrsiflorum TaxID=117978 RepID=A0ABD0VSN8_DENTH